MKMSLNICHVCKGTGIDTSLGKPIMCSLCKGTGNLPNISVAKLSCDFTGTVAERLMNKR